MQRARVIPLHPERIQLECAPYLYPPVLLPPDEYELVYVGHRVERIFRRGMLAAYFCVVDMLPEHVVVTRYYAVNITTKKDKTTGKTKTSWRPPKQGALVAEFRRLFPNQRLTRLDRFPVSWLADQYVIGDVGTVTKNYDRKPLEDAAYSVVRRLVKTCTS